MSQMIPEPCHNGMLSSVGDEKEKQLTVLAPRSVTVIFRMIGYLTSWDANAAVPLLLEHEDSTRQELLDRHNRGDVNCAAGRWRAIESSLVLSSSAVSCPAHVSISSIIALNLSHLLTVVQDRSS